MRIFGTPRYQDIRELLDDAGLAGEHELATSLRDIRRANIFGIGTWVVKHHLQRIVSQTPEQHSFAILDLGTGSADIPEELCRWADAQGVELSFVLTDISEQVLKIAKRRITAAGFADRVTFVVSDAAAPPFADKSFDVVICSLMMHHMNVRQAKKSMREMARLSRHGFVVNDIYRSKGAWLMAQFLVHFTTLNRLTRHDGPASVLRAFTPSELKQISGSAGVPVRVFKHPFWRVAAVGFTRV